MTFVRDYCSLWSISAKVCLKLPNSKCAFFSPFAFVSGLAARCHSLQFTNDELLLSIGHYLRWSAVGPHEEQAPCTQGQGMNSSVFSSHVKLGWATLLQQEKQISFSMGELMCKKLFLFWEHVQWTAAFE